MKELKIFIMGICILVIIIILALFSLNNNFEGESEDELESSNNVEGNLPIELSYEITSDKSISDFKTINDCMNTYLNYIKESNSEAILDVLIDDYVQELNINKNNVLNKIVVVNYEFEYMAKNVYKYDVNLNNVSTYFVKGYIINKDEKTKNEYNIVINIDSKNNTFELGTIEDTYTKYIDDVSNIKINNSDEFKKEIENISATEFNSIEIANGMRRQTNT